MAVQTLEQNAYFYRNQEWKAEHLDNLINFTINSLGKSTKEEKHTLASLSH
jgi:hypothetical protein